MHIHPPIHRQIEISFLRGVGQGVRVEVLAVDFGNGFRDPTFILSPDALAFFFDLFLITGLDTLINVLIHRYAVLSLCGQGGFALNEGIIILLGLLQIGGKFLHVLIVSTLGTGKDATL